MGFKKLFCGAHSHFLRHWLAMKCSATGSEGKDDEGLKQPSKQPPLKRYPCSLFPPQLQLPPVEETKSFLHNQFLHNITSKQIPNNIASEEYSNLLVMSFFV
jgi:hypothetical protein